MVELDGTTRLRLKLMLKRQCQMQYLRLGGQAEVYSK